MKDKEELYILKLFGIIDNSPNYDNRDDTLKVLKKLIIYKLRRSITSYNYNITKDLKISLKLKYFFNFIKIDHLECLFYDIDWENYELYRALAKFLPPEKIISVLKSRKLHNYYRFDYASLKFFVKIVLERADSGYIKTLYPWDRDTILYYLESIKKPSILNRAFTNFEIQNRRNQEFCIDGYIRKLSKEYNIFILDVIYSLIYKQTCFDELEYDLRNLRNSLKVDLSFRYPINLSFRHPIKYLQLFKRVKNITTPNYDSSCESYFEKQKSRMLSKLSSYIMSKFEEKHNGIKNLHSDWINFFEEINNADLDYMLETGSDSFNEFYSIIGRLLPIKKLNHLKLNIKILQKEAFFNALVDREDVNKEKLDYISKIHGYEFNKSNNNSNCNKENKKLSNVQRTYGYKFKKSIKEIRNKKFLKEIIKIIFLIVSFVIIRLLVLYFFMSFIKSEKN